MEYKNCSLYFEERVGTIAIGWMYFLDTKEYQRREVVGLNRDVRMTDESEVPDSIKKVFAIYLEGVEYYG